MAMSETQALAVVLQGALAEAASQCQVFMPITGVSQDADPDEWVTHFTVHIEGGHTIRVTVEAEEGQ